jgi:hypothetical protein
MSNWIVVGRINDMERVDKLVGFIKEKTGKEASFFPLYNVLRTFILTMGISEDEPVAFLGSEYIGNYEDVKYEFDVGGLFFEEAGLDIGV